MIFNVIYRDKVIAYKIYYEFQKATAKLYLNYLKTKYPQCNFSLQVKSDNDILLKWQSSILEKYQFIPCNINPISHIVKSFAELLAAKAFENIAKKLIKEKVK